MTSIAQLHQQQKAIERLEALFKQGGLHVSTEARDDLSIVTELFDGDSVSFESIKPFFFQRNFTIWKWIHFTSARAFNLDSQALPEKSILHYLPEDELDEGIYGSDPILSEADAGVFVTHVIKHSRETMGRTRPIIFRETTFVREYFRKNRNLRRVRNLDQALRNKKSLLVYNYAPLQHVLHYTPTFRTPYHRWYNVFSTMVDTLKNALTENDRTHYIRFKLPESLPTLRALRRATGGITQETIKEFKTFDRLTILEFWKLLQDDRSESLLAEIEEKDWDRVNFIFQGSRWTVINMKMLVGFLVETDEDAQERNPKMIRNRFLSLLMRLNEGSDVDSEDEDDLVDDEDAVEKDKATIVTEDEDEPVKVTKSRPVKEKSEEEIEAELDALEERAKEKLREEAIHNYEDVISHKAEEPDRVFKKKADVLADNGRLSGAEYRRALKLIERQKALPNPFGKGTLDEFRKITPEDHVIEDSTFNKDLPGVLNKGLLGNRGDVVRRKYLKKVMRKDIVNHAEHLQSAGFPLTGMEHQVKEDAAGASEIYTFRFAGLEGENSSLRFKFPVFDDNGGFKANGVDYYVRWLRGDVPVRKTGPDEVALTSYFGKVFVRRSDKVVDSYANWLIKNLTALGIDDSEKAVTDIKLSSMFRNDIEVPRIYSTLAGAFRTLTVNGYVLHLDYNNRHELLGKDAVVAAEKDKLVAIGKKGNNLVLVDELNNFFVQGTGNKLTELGRIENLVGDVLGSGPVDIAEINILGKAIPVGFILGYLNGFKTLYQILEVEPRIVPSGESLKLQPDEYAIRFADESYVFSKEDTYASMILSGFNRYKRVLTRYSVREFSKADVYKNILDNSGLSARYVKEATLMDDLFVDPITLDLLKQRKEPETFQGLLYFAVKLLTVDYHPVENDMRYQRLKLHERFTGMMYNEMVSAVRQHRNNPIPSKAKLEVNPEAVYMRILSEATVTKRNNPMHNIREKDDVTFSGWGGRSTESMTAKSRGFDISDIGTISEHTPDSNKVGVSSYLVANPTFDDIRGTTRAFDPKKDGVGSLLSVGANVSASSDRDDGKRTNALSTQYGSTIPTVGYVANPVRTGGERIVPHRTDDIFTYMAEQDGKVTEVTDELITVEYKDGTTKTVELGKRFGHADGGVVPHEILTSLKVGNKIKEGDLISFNRWFYEPDPLDPTQPLLKIATMMNVAFWESPGTLEDSSEVSPSAAASLVSKTTELRQIVVDFSQSLHQAVKEGDSVEYDSPLCLIEDSVTSANSLFDEKTLVTLTSLSTNAPKAKLEGVIDRIEVFYNGDIDEMSESLKAITKRSNKRLKEQNSRKGSKVVDGRVGNNMRIANQPLSDKRAVVNFYITGNEPYGIADKS